MTMAAVFAWSNRANETAGLLNNNVIAVQTLRALYSFL